MLLLFLSMIDLYVLLKTCLPKQSIVISLLCRSPIVSAFSTTQMINLIIVQFKGLCVIVTWNYDVKYNLQL